MNRPITFRTQLVMNGITLALVALIVLASNTFASPGRLCACNSAA